MEWRRRAHFPLERSCAFAPVVGGQWCCRGKGPIHNKQEGQHTHSGNVRADRRDEIPSSKGLRIVWISAGHARNAQEMHGKECQVYPGECDPKMDFPPELRVLTS